MKFTVTYRTLNASMQTGPSADVRSGDEITEEIEANSAVDAADVIQTRPGRTPGGIDILSVEPVSEPSREPAER
jgi:hypothetical protein